MFNSQMEESTLAIGDESMRNNLMFPVLGASFQNSSSNMSNSSLAKTLHRRFKNKSLGNKAPLRKPLK